MRYDPNQEPGWRWIPTRVRHDKTERLHRAQNAVKNKQGTNIARNPKSITASPDYNPDVYPTQRKERVVDGYEGQL
jgi:hypothetical protein